jgi:hypothetical protein
MSVLVCVLLLALITTPVRAQQCDEVLAGAPKKLDLVETYGRLAKLNTGKGEYETTAEFHARQQRLGIPAILFAAKRLDATSGSYDADTATLTVTGQDIDLAADFLQAATLTHAAAIEKDVTRGKRRYIGQNGYGATAVVTSAHTDQYYFAFAEDAQELDSLPAITIRVTPQEAKALRPHLELVVAGRPRTPPTLQDSYFDKATIDDPTELWGDKLVVLTNALCVGVRDDRSGRLLGSVALPSPIMPVARSPASGQ